MFRFLGDFLVGSETYALCGRGGVAIHEALWRATTVRTQRPAFPNTGGNSAKSQSQPQAIGEPCRREGIWNLGYALVGTADWQSGRSLLSAGSAVAERRAPCFSHCADCSLAFLTSDSALRGFDLDREIHRQGGGEVLLGFGGVVGTHASAAVVAYAQCFDGVPVRMAVVAVHSGSSVVG